MVQVCFTCSFCRPSNRLESSPYEGGQFKVKFTFSEEYPAVPPKGIAVVDPWSPFLGQFVTTIFHPNVSPSNGDICVSTLQKDWKPDLGLCHLLLVALFFTHPPLTTFAFRPSKVY